MRVQSLLTGRGFGLHTPVPKNGIGHVMQDPDQACSGQNLAEDLDALGGKLLTQGREAGDSGAGLGQAREEAAVPIWGKADGDDWDICGAPDRAGGGRPWGDEDVHRLTDQLLDNAGGEAEITASMSRLHEDRPAFDKVLL